MRCHEFFWFRSVNPTVGNWFGNNFSHGELDKPSQVTYESLFLITYFLFTYQPGWSFSWPRDDCYPSQLNGIFPWGTRFHLRFGCDRSQSFENVSLLLVTPGWGSNKSFNDNVTLLLESCVDQLMKNCICFVHFSQRMFRNKHASNQKSSSNGSGNSTNSPHLMWQRTLKQEDIPLHWPSYLFHEFTPIQQTVVEIIYPLLKFTGLYHVFIHPHLMSSTILHWISELAGITLLGKYH